MLLLEDKTTKIIEEVREYAMESFYISTDDDYCEAMENLYDFISDNKIGGEVCTGASKMVFVPDNENSTFVLKIPYYGSQYYHETYDEERGEYLDDGEYIAEDFEGAKNEVNDYDYCRTEVEVYEEAEKDGFAEFFPYTALYAAGSKTSPNIYIQEKAESFFDTEDEVTEEISNTASTISRNTGYVAPDAFVLACVCYYGAKRTQKFLDWVGSNERINDIHSGNIGRRSNGSPIIIDFAGFRH